MLLKTAKRVVIFVLGSTVVLIGLAAMVLPLIPGFVIVPIGLAILATEFAWAKSFLRKVKRKFQGMTQSGKKSEVPPLGDVEIANPRVLEPPHRGNDAD